MRELRFALGYMPHRLWGNVLQAQFLEKEEEKEFYVPREYVQNDPETHAYRRLTPMQREILGLIDQYSDRKLHKLFSRQKTVKEFQDSVEKETIEQHIRPYIERCMFKILEIVRDHRFSIFAKDKSNRNVFPEDFIEICKDVASPVFSFRYDQELTYSLTLMHHERRLALLDVPVEVVSNEPCIIILGSALYFVAEIDGKKLKPFMKRDTLVIPKATEGKYFSTFVRKTIRDFHSITEGFPVTELVPERRAELLFEEGWNRKPTFILSFQYNNRKIFADSNLNRFVSFTGTVGKPGFESFYRDLEWEEGIMAVLNEMGLRTRDQKNFYLTERFSKNEQIDLYTAINFINNNGFQLQESGISLRQRFSASYFLGPIELKMESREKEDWFDLHAVISFGEHKVSFLALKNNILNDIREFALPDGGIAVLPEEWFTKYRAIMEFGKPEGDGIWIHKQHFSMVEDSIGDLHQETLSRLKKLNEVKLLPNSLQPSGLNADLRSYQLEGYKWLVFLQENGFGGCLADDMGLGKTIQAIAVLLRSREAAGSTFQSVAGQKLIGANGQFSLFENRGTTPTSLIIVPASLVHNWKSECERFAPEIRVCLHVGQQRNRELTGIEDFDVLISTYHTVRQDIDILASYPFHYIILDESQMIKNASSKIYQAILELRSEHRIVLTGTPIENSLTDLWSQINFVNPGLLGTLHFFKKSFVQPIERKNDEQREEKLKDLINPFILRRTKEEVARELPPVFEQVRYCSMTEAQRKLYEEEKSLARNSILENMEEIGLEKSSMIVLQALTRLRQIANHPAMLEDFHELDSGKFTEVYRDIESVISEGHKVLIFSSFVKHLELFRNRLMDDHICHAYLTGSQNRRQRQQAVDQFQNDSQCPLFLISLKAGGVGLNLTAADYVFILDPWWNPAAEIQALSRAHRIGQDKNVFVYRFISNDTIEEKIQRLQERKKELAATFVSSNNPLRDISEKELLELFA